MEQINNVIDNFATIKSKSNSAILFNKNNLTSSHKNLFVSRNILLIKHAVSMSKSIDIISNKESLIKERSDYVSDNLSWIHDKKLFDITKENKEISLDTTNKNFNLSKLSLSQPKKASHKNFNKLIPPYNYKTTNGATNNVNNVNNLINNNTPFKKINQIQPINLKKNIGISKEKNNNKDSINKILTSSQSNFNKNSGNKKLVNNASKGKIIKNKSPSKKALKKFESFKKDTIEAQAQLKQTSDSNNTNLSTQRIDNEEFTTNVEKLKEFENILKSSSFITNVKDAQSKRNKDSLDSPIHKLSNVFYNNYNNNYQTTNTSSRKHPIVINKYKHLFTDVASMNYKNQNSIMSSLSNRNNLDRSSLIDNSKYLDGDMTNIRHKPNKSAFLNI